MVIKKTVKRELNKLENRLRTNIIIFYALGLIVLGLLSVDSPQELISGLGRIITTRDTLITDYIAVGGIGAAFVNSGLLMLIFIGLLKLYKVNFTGITYAALFLVAGFSLFGKNIFNVWPIIIGVYLFSIVQKEKFSKYIYIAIFGTAMSPLFTEVLYFDAFPLYFRIPFALFLSIFIGFILPPLSMHLLRVHQGYNLYNVGFTAGIIGTIIIALLRSYGFETSQEMIWSTGNNVLFGTFFYLYFGSMVVIGVVIDHKNILQRIKMTFQYSGRLITDLVILEGTSIAMINMGLLGIVSVSYILLIGGDLNGPTIGGIMTIAGFAAFGKNLKNTIPILLGVYIGSLTKTWDIADPSIQLAALFATSLAPIAGEFGFIYGIVAGFIHSSVVRNVGILHGGINLYNNGFSAGIVASVMVPILEVFRKDETD